MSPRLIPLLLIAALAGGPAMAAAGDPKPKPKRMSTPPPAPAADAALRGALPAPALARPQPATGLPAVDTGLLTLSRAGLSAPPPITPLPVVGDPAPICRAGCAQVRISCSSSGDSECDAPWAQCIADCSDPAATDARRKS